MARKDPSEIGEKSMARLAVLRFCSEHREDPEHEDEILEKVSEWFDRIEDVLEERDKELKKAKKAKRAKKKAKQEEVRELNRLLEELNGLKEQLQRTVDENGTMLKKISQLQRQCSEVEGAKNDVELATTVHAREKDRLEKELESIKKIAACSSEVKIKEVNELKVQLQKSGARVKAAAMLSDHWKRQIEESDARIESMKQETSEDIRELKSQLDRERGITMELNELTSQLKDSNTRLQEINTNLEKSNTQLKESKSHHEVIEQQMTAKVNKLSYQLDQSNTSLGNMRHGWSTEVGELKDQLTRFVDMIAELKAAESANIVQRECEANRSNHILKHCQTRIACDIPGSRQPIDSDDAVEQSKAASSHGKNQSTEEFHGLKEQQCDGKAASTMPTSILQMGVQNMRMWRHCSVCSSYVHLLVKQGKVGQVETANSALGDEVLRLREQAREVDRRLASQVVGFSLLSCRCFKVTDKYQEKISILKPRDVKQGICAATATQLLKIAVKGLDIYGNDVWLVLSSFGVASVINVRRASVPLQR